MPIENDYYYDPPVEGRTNSWLIDTTREKENHAHYVYIEIHIRNNSSLETRVYRESYLLETEIYKPFDKDTYPGVFMYTDGNYGCDCNRKILFDAKGYQEDLSCGTGAYSVNIYNPSTRECYYKEFDE